MVVTRKELPITNLLSNRKNVHVKQTYAGLKTLPAGSYERVTTVDNLTGESVTSFICKFRGCNKLFAKSTSMIVHYWRHLNVRPFPCKICNTSFTQSSTLSRHNRAVHKIHSTVSLTEE